jgi:hypothetical protein
MFSFGDWAVFVITPQPLGMMFRRLKKQTSRFWQLV